jgi:hypothetical protein
LPIEPARLKSIPGAIAATFIARDVRESLKMGSEAAARCRPGKAPLAASPWRAHPATIPMGRLTGLLLF